MRLVRGDRLSRPPGCPDALYDIMQSCWARRAEERPSFGMLEKKLGTLDPTLIESTIVEQGEQLYIYMPVDDEAIKAKVKKSVRTKQMEATARSPNLSKPQPLAPPEDDEDYVPPTPLSSETPTATSQSIYINTDVEQPGEINGCDNYNQLKNLIVCIT